MILVCSMDVQEREERNRKLDGYIKRIAQGDMEAFRCLYEMTKKSVYALALSLVRNSEDAEDLMQDTFLKIRGGAGLYRGDGKAMGWVMTVCRNLCLMKLRRDKFISYQSVESCSENLAATMGAVEDTLVLKAAFEKLSGEECQIVMLHCISGLKHREIGSMMEMPLSTVLSKYHRALKKLRLELEENV